MRAVNKFPGRAAATLAICSCFCAAAPAADKTALSGEFEYGEKYTDVYVDPEAAVENRDDEDFDRYVFRNSWLQLDRPIDRRVSVSVRAQQLERDYVSRPDLDNTTRYAQVRFAMEPHENWAIWPHVSIRRRDYDQRTLDNNILVAGVESRYRWGIRNNVRFGAAWTQTRYDDEPGRDREGGSVFASLEKPVTEGLTLRVGARAEQNTFRQQSLSRENATKGSASVGFRYEF